ncbi:hypothetical protein [Amycolatopsis sp. NPDC059021]|uniref:hypothetical protein n=1 Tax=Amycolatopsis sp. NPDC059021 TaxID=3346704 RepID=UPI003672D654
MSGVLSPALSGTVRYEATLALRRRAAWLSLIPLCLLALLLGLGSQGLTSYTDPMARMGATAMMVNALGSIGVAIALADRLAAQRRPGLRELLGTTPAGPAGRAAGVLLGPWLVALVPVALVLLALGVIVSASAGSARPLLGALIGLVTIVLPGSLLLTTIATLLGLILPVAAARILVIPLWYWATALSPLIPVPTITGTLLSPLGSYQSAVWLGTLPPPDEGGWLRPAASPAVAVLAIGVTLAMALLFFLLSRPILAVRR